MGLVAEDDTDSRRQEFRGQFAIIDNKHIAGHLVCALLDANLRVSSTSNPKIEQETLVLCHEVLPIVGDVFDQKCALEMRQSLAQHCDGRSAEGRANKLKRIYIAFLNGIPHHFCKLLFHSLLLWGWQH